MSKANTDGTIGSTYQDNAPPTEATEQKGDLLIRNLWQNGPNSVNDMCVVNTDANSHSVKTPKKCLQEAERGKKRMYLVVCLQQRREFSPSVALMDGLLGAEATETLKRTSSGLDTKWWKPYSRMCGYVKSRIAITLVRTTHWCIRGSRVPAHWIRLQQPQWEDGSRINLFR